MLNWSPNRIKTWVVLGVGALVLALSAFFILSNFSPDSTFAHDPDDNTFHSADNPITHTHYAENGTGPVLTYTSMDPEGMGIDWSLTGPDAGSFTISGGALKFMDPPDYESPKDVARSPLNMNGDDDTDDPGEDEAIIGDGEYEIVVMATEGRASNDMGPAKSNSTAVKVLVTDVNEAGTVSMEWIQPEVSTEITASVTDLDGATAGDVWNWYVSKVQDPSLSDANHWETAPGEGDETASYIPAATDKGKFLLVTVSYNIDGIPHQPMAQMKSYNRVQEDVPRADNASPDFRGGSEGRSVAENAAVGTVVGDPIVGYDPDNDTLTYSLHAAASPNDGDSKKFSMDKDSGQIRVNGKLDADGPDGRTGLGIENGKYVVLARVTDPSEDHSTPGSRSSDTITVTITANGVNENPRVEGTAEFTVAEDTNITQNNDYTASDPDAQTNVNWELGGKDKDLFRLAGTVARTLTFRDDPDYEMPGDANGDNVYLVTVVATDGSNGRGERMVTVTVRNLDEGGVVTLSSEQPHLGVPITATLEDEDGGEVIVKWQWSTSETRDGAFTPIAGATSATYTPNAAVNGIGNYLKATVTYTDPFSDMDNPDTADVDERVGVDSLKILDVISTNAIQAEPGVSMVPEFPSSASQRDVAENTAPGGKVGDPVLAMDPDSDDALMYELGGNEGRFFAIGSVTGQITVGGVTNPDDGKTNPMLDHEASSNRYTVEVTATDSQGEKGTVTVIISVTDRNEPPMFSVPEAVTDRHKFSFDEDATGPAYTYRAADPEGMGLAWDVTGPDAGTFTISGGVLRFMNQPDAEEAKDKESTDPNNPAGNNEYIITVRASETRASGYTGPAKTSEVDVTVTVNDVDEEGVVSLSWIRPEVGTPITASLEDPDGEETPMWSWHVSKIQGIPIINEDNHWEAATGTGKNGATYTPDPADENTFLRATASYDVDGTTVSPPSMMSDYRVRADVLSADNASPDFTGGEIKRSVDEDAAVGTAVGPPVAITAPDPDGDIVTYSLEVAPPPNEGDVAKFSVNKRTGQIMVNGTLDADGPENGKYVIVARVTDPSAARDAVGSNSSDMITVKITANQVNENPLVSGTAEFKVPEDTNITKNNDYTASDPDAQTNINWELDGDDKDAFQIAGTGARTLTFASAPDYEMPTDADGDNVYQVLVVATDGSGGRGARAVRVTVTNVEEGGKVMLSPEQPHLADPVTAMLSDPDIPDGEVTVSWQWSKSDTRTGTINPIAGATTVTYTPVSGDTGAYLRATATYRDAVAPDSDETVIGTSTNAVLATPATQNAPEFASATMNREVVENSPGTTVVGPPVLAMDPDMTDTLTYKLGGPDAGSFEIINDMSGQITVKLGRMLDYETKRTYTVEVTATDTTMLTDMVTVTIMVVDMNEAPDQPEELFGGLAITGPTSMDYEEGMTAAIGTYVAVGPVAGMATWSLSGDDMGDFYISNMGELTFASVPDFEMPMDMDNMYEVTVMAMAGGESAEREVTITVTNMNEDGTVTLWVGTNALTAPPQVGQELTGLVVDPDGNPGDTLPIAANTTINGVTWQWAKSMDMNSWMDIATGAMYTVMDTDDGYYLRATAMYDDGEGMDKMAYEMTMMVGAGPDGGILAMYDANDNSLIERSEAVGAVLDYLLRNEITRDQAIEVVTAHILQTAVP